MLRKVCFCLLAGLLAAVSARADVPVSSRLFTSLSYPVDIARAASLQVGAAYSMFRAMSANYSGPLFLLQRTSDSAYTAINTAGRGGPADFGAITSFCAARNTNGCQIVAICDQMHQTCSLSGGFPVNFSPVSVTVASPTLVTWSNGAGTTPPNDTPIFFDYKSHVGVDLNTKMPTGLAVINGTCSNCRPQWYCTSGISGNTFNVYPATVVSNLPTCPGASGNLVNVTGAGTASGLTANLGSINNDLNAYASNTAPPYLGFVSFPNGEAIPVWSSASGQLARARVGSNIPGTIPQNNINRTVYAIFTTMTVGTNAGTFGIMEDVINNKGANTMFAIGIEDSSSTGAFCSSANGPDVPCLETDLENGIFASTSMSPGLTVSNASPAVVTWNNHRLQAGTPVVFQDNGGDTLPSPLAKNTVYYVLNPATNTFNLSATPFGPAINTSTAGLGTHIAVGNSQTATKAGFAMGLITCDSGTGNGPTSGFTIELATELSPVITAIGYGTPVWTGLWSCLNANPLWSGSVSLGEGGDGSGSPTQFLEGFVAVGNMGQPYRQLLAQAVYNRIYANSGGGSPFYYAFTSGFLPGGFTYSRAACSPTVTGGCATDAEFTDAAGATFNQYADGNPVISNTTKGLGMFAQRSNYFANSNAPATQTTPSGSQLSATNTYKLFCNGTGSIQWDDSAHGGGTAVSIPGTGTINCSSSTIPGTGVADIAITTTGTLKLTVIGTVNWADLQNDAGTTNATVTFASQNSNDVSVAGNSNYRAGEQVYFTTTGTLPAGLSTNMIYYIVNPTGQTFQGLLSGHYNIAATPGGAAIATNGAGGSGTHTIHWFSPGASPHIVTAASVPVARQKDMLQLPAAAANALNGNVSAIVIEATHATWSGFAESQYGVLLGGSVSGDENLWWNQNQLFTGPGSSEGSFSNRIPAIQTKHRYAADLGQSIWSIAVDGTVSRSDTAGAGFSSVRGPADSTRYLGYDSVKNADCNCWITQAAIYPYYLTRYMLNQKTQPGATLP